nr:proline-rich receptor-like protein kinase PERK2 [Penaeus vannamei]
MIEQHLHSVCCIMRLPLPPPLTPPPPPISCPCLQPQKPLSTSSPPAPASPPLSHLNTPAHLCTFPTTTLPPPTQPSRTSHRPPPLIPLLHAHIVPSLTLTTLLLDLTPPHLTPCSRLTFFDPLHLTIYPLLPPHTPAPPTRSPAHIITPLLHLNTPCSI